MFSLSDNSLNDSSNNESNNKSNVEQFNNNNNTQIEKRIEAIEKELTVMSNIVNKMYVTDTQGKHIVHGWFAEFHNVIDHPAGIILGEMLNRVHGASSICFSTKESFPFLGQEDNPIFFPKADNVGMRAMTIFKIPKTGAYDFKITTDDGMRLFFQKVHSDVILNEKNVRSEWIVLVDSWVSQSENQIVSGKYYFNESDLILIRMDYYELGGYSSACVKYRYYVENSDQVIESILPYDKTFCSLLWSEVPLLGYM